MNAKCLSVQKPATLRSNGWVLIALVLGCGAGFLAAPGHAAEGAPDAYHAPALAVTNESGVAVPLFSAAAYRAEFKYLQRVFHETDLKGPPVKTDGWNYNIAEAEWPLMSFAYFGYACVDLANTDPGFREPALAEVRWLIEAIQTPRLSGFMTPHFGPPFSLTNAHSGHLRSWPLAPTGHTIPPSQWRHSL